MKILLLYHTKTTHTLEAGTAVAEGIKEAGSECTILLAKEFDPSLLSEYDGLIIGSPCWAGSTGLPGVPFPIVNAIDLLSENALNNIQCGGFSVHSIAGGGKTIRTIDKLLAKKGCQEFIPGPTARAGTPFSILKGPSVKKKSIELFKAYGIEFTGKS